MMRISRAELASVFAPSAKASPHRDDRLRLPTGAANSLAPFPPNAYLLATMDIEQLRKDADLSSNICLFSLQQIHKPNEIDSNDFGAIAKQLARALRSNSRFDPDDAWSNLPGLPAEVDPRMLTRRLLELIETHGVEIDPALLWDAKLYLGNAWACSGMGLFDEDPSENARQAFLFWFQQSIVRPLFHFPRADFALRKDLKHWLRAHAFREVDLQTIG
jgi:hypothetical protein